MDLIIVYNSTLEDSIIGNFIPIKFIANPNEPSFGG
jgi:hypothetical protein